MTLSTRHLLGAACTLALLGFAAPAFAQDTSFTFDLARSKGSAIGSIHKSIESLVDDMNFIKRPFARSKLKDTNKVCGKIFVTQAGSDLTVQCDASGKKFTTPASGAKKKVIGSDGESEYMLSQKISGNTLTQKFEGEDGSRLSIYSWDPETKKMTLKVTVSSPKLPRALKYTLPYKY